MNDAEILNKLYEIICKDLKEHQTLAENTAHTNSFVIHHTAVAQAELCEKYKYQIEIMQKHSKEYAITRFEFNTSQYNKDDEPYTPDATEPHGYGYEGGDPD